MKKNNVPILQKIIAYLVICLSVFTFAILRTQKIEKVKTKENELFMQLESLLTDSLYYLYNDNLEEEIKGNIIHPDYIPTLRNKFKTTNEVLKESNMSLTSIGLSKNRIYNTKKDSIKYIIYDGLVELKWTSKEYDVETDTETKHITGYIIQNDDGYHLANIDIKAQEK